MEIKEQSTVRPVIANEFGRKIHEKNADIYIYIILSKSENITRVATFLDRHYSVVLTRQSLLMVLQTALYLSPSINSPSCISCMKSRSLYVGTALSLSLAEALRL